MKKEDEKVLEIIIKIVDAFFEICLPLIMFLYASYCVYDNCKESLRLGDNFTTKELGKENMKVLGLFVIYALGNITFVVLLDVLKIA